MKFDKEYVVKSAKLVLIVCFSVFAGGMLHKAFFVAPPAESQHKEHEPKKEQTWTCSMHPQVQLPKPGKCPICFMDLIPLEEGDDDESERELTVTSYAAKLMEIETSEVVRKFVDAEVMLIGKVEYDETKIAYISAWVPGRLDRLFVNYTGIPVKKGDHMVEMYSPDLLTAQEELIQAMDAVENLRGSDSDIVRRTASSTVEAAAEKLRLLGLRAEQIDKVKNDRAGSDHVTIYAPQGGIVIDKNAQEGMYVQTGTRIYTIADLSTVWVMLDAYESDLQWLRYGSRVEFSSEAHPGRRFEGTVSFMDPVIDSSTRTADVRVMVNNENLALKPGMFVRAVVHTKVAANGQVMDRDLQGKWISPMHPEVIKEEPGSCDVCGMPLVSAESLGYVSNEHDNAPLVIPVSAALKTGKRAVVYREVQDREKPTFEGVEVVLGPRLREFYVVESGLKAGDRVVTRGAFKLDAELQIRAKPSMMSVSSDAQSGHLHGKMDRKETSEISVQLIPEEFRKQLNVVVGEYFDIQKALAADDSEAVEKKVKTIVEKVNDVDMSLLADESHMTWMKHLDGFNSALEKLKGQEDISKQREAFSLLSSQLMRTIKAFPVTDVPIFKGTCPMAFDNQGASWLQESAEIANPYFGEMMLRCGEIEEMGAADDE